MSRFAQTPEPPYYAVIFTAQHTPDDENYMATAMRLVEMASSMPGYLGLETTCGADGLGITVSYWRSEEDIARWKAVAEHREAQQTGKVRWYEHYELRIAKVERAYNGPAGR